MRLQWLVVALALAGIAHAQRSPLGDLVLPELIAAADPGYPAEAGTATGTVVIEGFVDAVGVYSDARLAESSGTAALDQAALAAANRFAFHPAQLGCLRAPIPARVRFVYDGAGVHDRRHQLQIGQPLTLTENDPSAYREQLESFVAARDRLAAVPLPAAQPIVEFQYLQVPYEPADPRLALVGVVAVLSLRGSDGKYSNEVLSAIPDAEFASVALDLINSRTLERGAGVSGQAAVVCTEVTLLPRPPAPAESGG